jgi:2,3-bisphosphoglycerate-independent phosphoglycerate mutase
VHSLQEHLEAVIDLAGRRGVRQVAVHALLDGRDTPRKSGAGYLRQLRDFLGRTGYGVVATVMGRYHAMDRDNRWDRVARAYDAMTRGVGERTADYVAAVEASYKRNVPDEFVEPIVVDDGGGQPVASIKDGDAVIFFNFRADRARQITRALYDTGFTEFERAVFPQVHVATMTEYDSKFPLPIAFGPETMPNILAEVAAGAGKKNLRIAETEKYAHVTYFFNGGREEPFPGESRILIPSPQVATYDLQPGMSAPKVAGTLIKELEKNSHDFIVCNFANGDMVGHTGVLEAAVKAVETVDTCVGRILEAVDLSQYAVIITADHGNAERMFDPATGDPHTAHTTNLVPCILIDPDYSGALIEDGALRDFAPTICNYIGLPVPAEMTGRDLRREV